MMLHLPLEIVKTKQRPNKNVDVTTMLNRERMMIVNELAASRIAEEIKSLVERTHIVRCRQCKSKKGKVKTLELPEHCSPRGFFCLPSLSVTISIL